MRRIRLFIESADSGIGVAAEVALIMGRLLGWSRRRRAAETRRYLEPGRGRADDTGRWRVSRWRVSRGGFGRGGASAVGAGAAVPDSVLAGVAAAG